MKILIGDIELSHAVYAAYPSKKPQFLRHNQMLHPQFMISFAYNWYGKKAIKSVSVLDDKERFERDYRDDEHVVRTMYSLLEEADAFCGHNSSGFDLKHFNYKAHLLGLPPIEIAKIDTLKAARKHFKAPSNSMDALLKDIGHVGKQEKPTFCEWLKATQGDKKAIRKVVRYNKHDIEGQIFLYEKLRPWIDNHPNFNLFVRDIDGNEVGVCRNCGSPNLHSHGQRKLMSGSMRHIYRCVDCGAQTRFNRAVKRAKFV